MSDSAGDAGIVTIDATVMPAAEKSVSEQRRFLGAFVYFIVAVIWYFVVRVAVLGVFSIPWALLPKDQLAAATWMLFGQPIGLGVGVYLTLRTNVRNRPFHFMLVVVAFASIVFGHISWAVANPYVERAVDGLRITAWVMEAIGIGIGALIGWRKTRVKDDIKIPKMLLPPRMRRAREEAEAAAAAAAAGQQPDPDPIAL